MSDVSDTVGPTASVPRRVGRAIRSLVSYTLFGLGVLALWSFFAPHVGVAAVAWYEPVTAEIAAPTEGDAIINVTPLLVGLVVTSVGVWLR